MKTLIALFAFTLFAVNVMASNNRPTDASRNAALVTGKTVEHTDATGNVIATSRYISDLQLPLPVLKRLMKECPDEIIKLVREFETENGMIYVITLENETGYKVVKVTGNSFRKLQAFDKAL